VERPFLRDKPPIVERRSLDYAARWAASLGTTVVKLTIIVGDPTLARQGLERARRLGQGDGLGRRLVRGVG
jgi:hypothetical protein